MQFLTLDGVDAKEKSVFVRADLNCPVQGGKPTPSARLSAHAKTILELSQRDAKTIILAHQGRKGRDDFISLKPHSKLLEGEISKLNGGQRIEVKFAADVCGKQAQDAIKSLQPGQILLLENTRFLGCEKEFEKTKKCELIGNLQPLCDIFVLDAFSVSHRAHASVVGFKNCTVCAGRVMQSELEALKQFENPKKPTLLIFGGAKPADSLPIMKSWLEQKKADSILCTGALANLMLLASGKKIGPLSEQFLQKTKSLEGLGDAKALYENYNGKLKLPQDVVLNEDSSPNTIEIAQLPAEFPIQDIGPKTISAFKEEIKNAGSIVLNGPAGVYEQKGFGQGTKELLTAISNSPAFSLLGGGHTLSALKKFEIPHSKFGYVSLSGKALIEYLSGQTLPGVQLLLDKSG